jgi:hypothetical protein
MKFSICLPTYKGAHVLGMALEGIGRIVIPNQDFEILIGDDNPCSKITTNSKVALPNTIIINRTTL